MSDASATGGVEPRADRPARMLGARRAPAADAVRSGRLLTVAAAYCVLIVGAEAARYALGAVPAAALDAVLLVALIDHFVIGSRSARVTRILPALALVPLLQLASLALAVRSPLVSLCLAGVPILLATDLVARETGLFPLLSARELRNPTQWGPALAAIPAGAIAVHLFGRHPLQPGASPALVLAGCAVIFVFGGLLEELVFRGVIQRTLDPLGAWSVLLANLLFAATYIASGSAAVVAAAAIGGALAGWWTRRTGSVAGAAVAHGVLAAGYLVVWPALLG